MTNRNVQVRPPRVDIVPPGWTVRTIVRISRQDVPPGARGLARNTRWVTVDLQYPQRPDILTVEAQACRAAMALAGDAANISDRRGVWAVGDCDLLEDIVITQVYRGT